MNEQSTVTAPAAPQQKRSLVRLYLTLMVVYGAIAGISAYGFYYNYQDGGVGVLLAVAAAVTVAATLLYVLPYKLHTIVQIVLAVLLPYVNLVLLEWFTHNPWETSSGAGFGNPIQPACGTCQLFCHPVPLRAYPAMGLVQHSGGVQCSRQFYLLHQLSGGVCAVCFCSGLSP